MYLRYFFWNTGGTVPAIFLPIRLRFCKAKEANQKAERLSQLRELAQSVVITTTHNMDGHRVIKYLGIQSVEFVIGTGFFSGISTEVNDFFGQRSRYRSRANEKNATAATIPPSDAGPV